MISIIGAGTMGAGIAMVAARAGHDVALLDSFPKAVDRARGEHASGLNREVEKGRLSRADADAVQGRIRYWPVAGNDYQAVAGSDLVIEAVVEDLSLKREIFRQVEDKISPEGMLATNTSSLSITAIAASARRPAQVVGIHFFNPATILPLVEIVPGLLTDPAVTARARALIDRWGKTTVLASDTPGFIVNRVARPFYGEALRIFEEGLADAATIDWAMRDIGGFKMGPFELMDLIGNDVNYAVSRTVFEAFGFDPRYRPSLTQKRLVDAGLLGKKTGRGHFDYRPGASNPAPNRDGKLGEAIASRIIALLINAAVDALFWRVASRDDLDMAMTKGVNYPKGLLRWADEIGPSNVLGQLERLHHEYGEERYRPSPLLKRMAQDNDRFYS